jgi:hypothetical protein
MTTALEIKSLQKSNTFSSLATGGQRLGTWFDRRARKISMKCSKSITLGRFLCVRIRHVYDYNLDSIQGFWQNSDPGPEPEKEFLDMNFDKRLEYFAPCYSQPILLADFTENHTLLWF